jgi:hypothetical protein
VVAAVEIVIDVHLPVARQFVLDPAGEFEPVDLARRPRGERGEVILDRLLRRVQMYPNEWAPDRDRDGDETVVLLAEFLNAVELGRAAELAGEVVRPAVVAAAKLGGGAARLVQDRGGAVSADVEEGPENTVLRPHDQDRLAGDVRGEE